MTKTKKNAPISTEDILLKLCHSVSSVLTEATRHEVNYSPMVQRIGKTCLRPDIGCFVLFDGAFSGLVVINFSQDAYSTAEVAEVDAALLTDDLPPSAYADPGFVQFLKAGGTQNH